VIAAQPSLLAGAHIDLPHVAQEPSPGTVPAGKLPLRLAVVKNERKLPIAGIQQRIVDRWRWLRDHFFA